VVSKLMSELPETIRPSETLVDKARVLDNFYIPARYPNAHPSGAPFQHFGKLQSQEAIDYARTIIEFVRRKMA
jgi:HEPN domain-containing protein